MEDHVGSFLRKLNIDLLLDIDLDIKIGTKFPNFFSDIISTSDIINTIHCSPIKLRFSTKRFIKLFLV